RHACAVLRGVLVKRAESRFAGAARPRSSRSRTREAGGIEVALDVSRARRARTRERAAIEVARDLHGAWRARTRGGGPPGGSRARGRAAIEFARDLNGSWRSRTRGRGPRASSRPPWVVHGDRGLARRGAREFAIHACALPSSFAANPRRRRRRSRLGCAAAN